MRGDGGRARVAIVGGGFGGLAAARALRGAPVEVVLVDCRNHHLFQPLLYQVATAGLNPSDIAAPIRGVLRRQKNCRVLLARVDAVDLAGKRLVLADGELAWDALILAAGATTTWFGHDDWARHAPGLKSVEDALELRRRVLFAFEAAEREDDPAARDAWLTFAVVGGGATGVELAGALAELSRHTLARDFRRIEPRRARIVLLEGGDDVLPAFAPDLRASARRALERLGVELRLGTRAARIDAHGVAFTDGGALPARTVLWAAGVMGSPLARTLGCPLDRGGRALVAPTLAVPGRTDAFVVGDLAALEQDGRWLPGVAQVALQGGAHAARNALRGLAGQPLLPFRYRDRGNMATIGRRAAVADLGWLRLTGPLAWLAWLALHLVFLIDFRSRVLVLFQWLWAYVTFQRGARLITGPVDGAPPALRAPAASTAPPAPEPPRDPA